MHRRGPGGALEAQRVLGAQRRGEVHRSKVQPGVEALGEGVLAEIGAGPGEDRDLEVIALELPRERPADVGGASARIEIDTHQHLCLSRGHPYEATATAKDPRPETG